jgi:hypothetical protein
MWAMSVSSEVQRTLVKSPPELWAELSDPTTLARHLGELGEIRIVRTEPDRAVDWEAAATDGAQASGRVEIEPSGWGTRVTLSASRTVAVPEPAVPEPDPIQTEASESEAPELQIAASEPELDESGAEEPEPEPVEPEPRRGFFARLFRRARKTSLETNAQPGSQPEIEPDETCDMGPPGAVEVGELASGQALPATEIASEPDISIELAELEEQTTAVLSGVLDRLGAAHHRPFSRS